MQLNSIEDIGRHHRHIYLAPHFDDAVMSCGGSIAFQRMAGPQVLAITIFGSAGKSGSALTPFATQLQRETGLGSTAEEAIARRKEEDAAACNLLDADYLWLDFPDALYRGYNSREALFGAIDRADLSIEEQVAAIVLEIQSRAPMSVIYAPLGVGHHVDHQIVCSAADRLAQQKVNVKFYEDFPYVAAAGALEDRQRELGLKMEPELCEVSVQIPTKIEAISLYRSQVPQLYGTQERMRQMVEGYHGSIRKQYPGIKIERFWRW